MIDNKQLIEYSSKYKIDQYTILREYIQLVFLNALYENKLSKDLIFKGGTALRLAYTSPRFSEDLDFNCELKIEELKNLLSVTLNKVSNIVPNIYSKEIISLQGYSSKLYFKSNISTIPLTIKLDFSFREKSLDTFQTALSTELPMQVYSLINVFSTKEILAEKFRTVFQRTKGRDIYDIWFLLNKKTELDLNMVNKKMKLINQKFNCIEFESKLKQFEQKQLENDLYKFLPINQRAIVSNLIQLIIQDPQVEGLS